MDPQTTDPQTTDPQTTDPELWPAREISPARDLLIEQRAAKILQAMSVPEKVGQMIQPELKYITPAEVKKFHIGSVLNGGGTTPNNDKFATVQDWANLAEQFYQASTDESDGKAGIPLICGSDAVHGNNNVYGMTLFPHNIGLGAAGDPELLYRIGQVTALEVAVTGVDWTFGPTVAVARDVRWGRTYESYS
jgi:beta-glucosidase